MAGKSRLLLLGGTNTGSSAGLVDLSRTDLSNCVTVTDLPEMLSESAGGFVGGKPVICGGRNGPAYRDGSASCYEYDIATSTWVLTATIPDHRRGMASVQIDDDTLWMSGGIKLTSSAVSTQKTGYNYNAGSSPILTTGQGFTFPGRVYHCMVKISDTQYFLAGTGYTGQFRRNFIFNGDPSIPMGSWTELPQLAEGRNTPFCGLVTRGNGVQEVI